MTSRRVISRESRQCSQIRPFLYVGGLAALSPRTLSRFCTTVNLIPGFRISAPNHMKVLHIPLLDDESTDLSPFFTTVFKEIDDARKSAGRVLLLCAMGISRSATFAITYLMCIEKMSLHDAYKHVQYCRNIICPNVGFFQQMIDLEQKLYGTKTVRIIEPIPGVKVADVVWNELYQEMMDSLSEADRHSVRSYNPRPESARQQDTRSLRSLNLVTEEVDGMVRELSSCRLAESQAATNDGAVLVEVAPRIPTLISTTPSPYPKSALRDKSKSSKNKRWRLSFSKDVT
ncbi:Tyrosine-protein phosphatase domain-containing protein [Trichostrongylus colubriformis]|uniref:Tyrosine-protein phosphatase domain-containing protein n=1 Tax=Trichostrongylus colubriformis TaxID=6319 RepID=A0AAN8FCX0_TRICO